MTKIIKHIFLATIVFAIGMSGLALGADDDLAPGERWFLVKVAVQDQRAVKVPTQQEIMNRFVIELNGTSRWVKNVGEIGQKAIIGIVKKGSTFTLNYKTDDALVFDFGGPAFVEPGQADFGKKRIEFNPPNSPIKHFLEAFLVHPYSTQEVEELQLMIGICDEECKY